VGRPRRDAPSEDPVKEKTTRYVFSCPVKFRKGVSPAHAEPLQVCRQEKGEKSEGIHHSPQFDQTSRRRRGLFRSQDEPNKALGHPVNGHVLWRDVGQVAVVLEDVELPPQVGVVVLVVDEPPRQCDRSITKNSLTNLASPVWRSFSSRQSAQASASRSPRRPDPVALRAHGPPRTWLPGLPSSRWDRCRTSWREASDFRNPVI
jgi:hypothetical protein